MDSIMAGAMGAANCHNEPMVFDWDEAARLIKESGCSEATAGLRGDWEWTGGCIFRDGKPDFKSYTYLASVWAVPELCINHHNVPCYKMAHEVPGWGSDTKWPESALKILEGGEDE